MRERLRQLFDLVDPMPTAVEPPVDFGWERLAYVPEKVRTRGSTMTFALGNRVLHVEVGVVVTGLVIPAVDEVEVRWPDGVTWVPVDKCGFFELGDVPRGPVRIVIGNAATGWFVR
jgi:hypothetical protein